MGYDSPDDRRRPVDERFLEVCEKALALCFGQCIESTMAKQASKNGTGDAQHPLTVRRVARMVDVYS